jgi:hypothetical protein
LKRKTRSLSPSLPPPLSLSLSLSEAATLYKALQTTASRELSKFCLQGGATRYRGLQITKSQNKWGGKKKNPQKLALTSPTSGGRSVGIVRSRTKATECVRIHEFKNVLRSKGLDGNLFGLHLRRTPSVTMSPHITLSSRSVSHGRFRYPSSFHLYEK